MEAKKEDNLLTRREHPFVDLSSQSLQNRTEQAPWLPDLGQIQFFIGSYDHLDWKQHLKSVSSTTNQAHDSEPCLSVLYLHVFYVPPEMLTLSLPWAACAKA